MPLITDIYSLVRFEEGDRQFVYDDYNGKPIRPGSHVFGHPTAGVGRALDIEGLTQAERDYLLTNNVQTFYALFNPLPWFAPLDPIRKAAIIDLAFDVGYEGTLEFKDMVTALSAKDWKAAHDAVIASDWWKGPTQARATRVANMLESGAWPSASD